MSKSETTSEIRIGAVFYPAGAGGRADLILSEVADRLRSEGLRLGGAIQRNTDNGDRCRCEMTLEDLASGRRIKISEDRGAEARGCRLDSFALEELVGLASASVEGDIDLLIVNKFGKREAEGHGFCQAIEGACAIGIPVLMTVSSSNADAWREYVGEAGVEVSFDPDAIAAWCRTAAWARRRAAETGPHSPEQPDAHRAELSLTD